MAGWTKIDEVPFGFERRRVSVLIERAGVASARTLVVKGAPEDVLRLCTRYEGDSPQDLRPLDGAARAELRERFVGGERPLPEGLEALLEADPRAGAAARSAGLLSLVNH